MFLLTPRLHGYMGQGWPHVEGCKFSGNLVFPETSRKFPEILAEAWKL